ncbi:stalk domain-containing protein [Paenibacillus flagellatus]|uniref:Copper amine oxidase-like N-terminal domain-containing protein n=1 Tax=Paenibacillus flagellatus TaxID=2211139 RepID=A0A2V5KIH7_9BACL|nr:stalk domain-containing protein [Paenibacillus flagellatus]PYI54260.1 hypothetical protein DLM86_12320 [Paenibacillus flagellatus]
MKKFLGGMLFGLILGLGSVGYASDAIQAVLFPSTFNFNGETKAVSDSYDVLNYKNHVYVPIRFVAENLKSTVSYDEGDRTISILSPAGGPLLQDPGYPEVSIGNIQIHEKKKGKVVSGLVLLDDTKIKKAGPGLRLYGKIVFYDHADQVLGSSPVSITYGRTVNPLHMQHFEETLYGDFSSYAKAKLFIALLSDQNHPPIPEVYVDGKVPRIGIGSYCWLGCATGRIVYEALPATAARSGSELTVSFRGNNKPDSPIKVRRTNERQVAVDEVLMNGKVKLPTEKGTYYYKMTAFWSGKENTGGDAEYGFVIHVE